MRSSATIVAADPARPPGFDGAVAHGTLKAASA
jgi:hypothetical protein